MPEQSTVRTVATTTLLGIMSEVPGLGGLAGAIQGVASATARARDEDWWAMVAARVTSLEGTIQTLIRFDDPEFVAAAYRFNRAAQETGDQEKRQRLASALAHAGSWSDLPLDARERVGRLIAEMSSREIFLLGVLSDPSAWISENAPDAASAIRRAMFGSVRGFLNKYVIKGDTAETNAARAALEALERRGLVRIPEGTMSGQGVLDGRATELGRELVQYLRSIHD